jgi:sugar phosphate isomerase/epimerase
MCRSRRVEWFFRRWSVPAPVQIVLESAVGGRILGVVILCASGLRFASVGGERGGEPKALVRRAADAGFDGVAIGDDCARADLAPLCSASRAAGLSVSVIAGALPEGPLGPGRRLPYLASLDDSDERRAAVALFESTLGFAVSLGIRLLAVHLGDLPLRTRAEEVAYRFARRELGEDEPGERLWAAAIGERMALSGAVLDASRHALDRIVPRAERSGVELALEVAGGPWSGPSPREALLLADEYRDGPVGLIWDEARMQVLTTLGLAPGEERRATLAAASTLWRANDAVGIETGYLPGLGDPPARDGRSAEPGRPGGIPVVVAGRRDCTPWELGAARVRASTAAASLNESHGAPHPS